MCSVREVEVIVGVGVVLTLSKHGSNEVEGGWDPSDTEPDTETIVKDNTLDEEALESTEEEVVEPLLGGIGTMVEDETTSIGSLLIEVLFTVPVGPHGLWNSETLSIGESHVADIALLVVLKSSSYTHTVDQCLRVMGRPLWRRVSETLLLAGRV